MPLWLQRIAYFVLMMSVFYHIQCGCLILVYAVFNFLSMLPVTWHSHLSFDIGVYVTSCYTAQLFHCLCSYVLQIQNWVKKMSVCYKLAISSFVGVWLKCFNLSFICFNWILKKKSDLWGHCDKMSCTQKRQQFSYFLTF